MSTLDSLNGRDDGQEPAWVSQEYTPSTPTQVLMCCGVCAVLIAIFLVVSGLVAQGFAR